MKYDLQYGIRLEQSETEPTPQVKRKFIVESLTALITDKIAENGKSRIGIGRYDSSEGADNLRLYMPEVYDTFKSSGHTVAKYNEEHYFIYLISI
jgi:hypothetical protein